MKKELLSNLEPHEVIYIYSYYNFNQQYTGYVTVNEAIYALKNIGVYNKKLTKEEAQAYLSEIYF
jgi:hypothetical protein